MTEHTAAGVDRVVNSTAVMGHVNTSDNASCSRDSSTAALLRAPAAAAGVAALVAVVLVAFLDPFTEQETR